jgi:hypothetical protein
VRQFVIKLIRGCVVKRRMAELLVVEAHPLGEGSSRRERGAERIQIKVVEFDAPSQPFNEDVIQESSAAV